MNAKSRIKALILLGTVAAVGIAQAQLLPAVNISERHGNLRTAQEHIVQAYQLVGVAQQENGEKLGGHADKARQLLAEADQELRLAADWAETH